MRRHNESSQLEARLRRSLTRRAAPSDFSGRIMRRVRADAGRAPREAEPPRFFGLAGIRLSLPRTLAACACAVAVLIAVAFPGWQSRRQERLVATQSAERDLAEVLQLAGHGWVRAQEAAFSPLQDNDND